MADRSLFSVHILYFCVFHYGSVTIENTPDKMLKIIGFVGLVAQFALAFPLSSGLKQKRDVDPSLVPSFGWQSGINPDGSRSIGRWFAHANSDYAQVPEIATELSRERMGNPF